MRIGFDGKRLFNNLTGLGNYSRYIISLVNRNFQGNENLIYTPDKPAEISNKEILQSPKNQIKSTSNFLKSAWRSYSIVKDLQRDKIDIYHGLSNELPFGIAASKIPSVVTIHDLIFLRYPQYYSKINRWIYRIKSRYACKYADRIITVSEQTKQDIIHFFGISPDKIDVVYQSSNKVFEQAISADEKTNICSKYNLPTRFILNVGTIEPRKNLLLLVKALKQIEQSVSLVVIGKKKKYARKITEFINQNQLQNRVIFLSNVPGDDLPGIYQQADVFVYPSRYEGFGIPLIEALHSKVPVIAATGSCLEEAGGAASLYTHPDNFEQLACLIQSVLDNPDKRNQMIEAGLKHVQKFNDELIAPQLLNTYQKAIAHAKR